MSNISEVKVGSLIRVKIGKNLILARVLEVLDDGFRVCSLSKNKEFNVPQSRVELDAGDAEQPAAEQTPAPASTASDPAESEEPQTEAEQEPAEPEAPAQIEQESAEEQAESGEEAEASEAPTVEVVPEDEAAEEQAESGEEAEASEAPTVEVVPEDEAAEFTPSGEDQEDEYAINPAHESDKPVKRMSLLDAAVIVLKDAGPNTR